MKCKKCFLTKDESEFSTRFDGTKFYFCKECMVIEYSERRNKRGFALEVQIKRAKSRQRRKLTEAQVVEIQAKRKAGVTYTQLATEYGVSQQVIGKVSRFGYAQG